MIPTRTHWHRVPDRLRHVAYRIRRTRRTGHVHRQEASRTQPTSGHRTSKPGGQRQAPRFHRRLHRSCQSSDRSLAIYSTEDAPDITQGLKSILSEVPISGGALPTALAALSDNWASPEIEMFIKENWGHLAHDYAVANRAVAALKDVKARADFDVYFKKFLQSLNLILPNPAGQPYRGAARRFGYLLQRPRNDSRTTHWTSRMRAKR